MSSRKDDDRFRNEIGRRVERRRRARQDRERGIWYGLGMMGLVGWTVAIPVLLAVALGVWLDRSMGTGVAWTLSLVVLGFGVGSFVAWRWVRRESASETDRDSVGESEEGEE